MTSSIKNGDGENVVTMVKVVATIKAAVQTEQQKDIAENPPAEGRESVASDATIQAEQRQLFFAEQDAEVDTISGQHLENARHSTALFLHSLRSGEYVPFWGEPEMETVDPNFKPDDSIEHPPSWFTSQPEDQRALAREYNLIFLCWLRRHEQKIMAQSAWKTREELRAWLLAYVTQEFKGVTQYSPKDALRIWYHVQLDYRQMDLTLESKEECLTGALMKAMGRPKPPIESVVNGRSPPTGSSGAGWFRLDPSITAPSGLHAAGPHRPTQTGTPLPGPSLGGHWRHNGHTEAGPSTAGPSTAASFRPDPSIAAPSGLHAACPPRTIIPRAGSTRPSPRVNGQWRNGAPRTEPDETSGQASSATAPAGTPTGPAAQRQPRRAREQ